MVMDLSNEAMQERLAALNVTMDELRQRIFGEGGVRVADSGKGRVDPVLEKRRGALQEKLFKAWVDAEWQARLGGFDGARVWYPVRDGYWVKLDSDLVRDRGLDR